MCRMTLNCKFDELVTNTAPDLVLVFWYKKNKKTKNKTLFSLL